MAREALRANPRMPGMRAQIGAAFTGKKSEVYADSAVLLVREMIANGEDKQLIAGIAVAAGDVLRQIPDQMRAGGADAAAVHAAWEKAYTELTWADSLARGTTVAEQAKFLMGVAALSVGQGYLTTAGDVVKKVADEIKARNVPAGAQRAMYDRVYPEACSLTNKANDYFVVAQVALPAGGRFAPDATRQVMGALMQMNGFVEQMTKAYCRAGTSRPGEATAQAAARPKP
jgi:predicted transcriptional regulator